MCVFTLVLIFLCCYCNYKVCNTTRAPPEHKYMGMNVGFSKLERKKTYRNTPTQELEMSSKRKRKEPKAFIVRSTTTRSNTD